MWIFFHNFWSEWTIHVQTWKPKVFIVLIYLISSFSCNLYVRSEYANLLEILKDDISNYWIQSLIVSRFLTPSTLGDRFLEKIVVLLSFLSCLFKTQFSPQTQRTFLPSSQPVLGSSHVNIYTLNYRWWWEIIETGQFFNFVTFTLRKVNLKWLCPRGYWFFNSISAWFFKLQTGIPPWL